MVVTSERKFIWKGHEGDFWGVRNTQNHNMDSDYMGVNIGKIYEIIHFTA